MPDTYEEWQELFEQMKKDLAEVKTVRNSTETTEYGKDILLDRDDLSGSDDPDSIFDKLNYDDDYDYSSDLQSATEEDGIESDGASYDKKWFHKEISAYCSRRNGLPEHELSSSLLASLESGIQSTSQWYFP